MAYKYNIINRILQHNNSVYYIKNLRIIFIYKYIKINYNYIYKISKKNIPITPYSRLNHKINYLNIVNQLCQREFTI